ncbi:PREDICTED: uncharacterized protein LOC100633819 isoform X2 [Amphimedon queenslandica]|uniref:PDZ domain-containing protein n=1 Tax=Amphimedon queenslandica TaxID=400682 RepID=A0AAN0JG07_AMPQE|nr:PREDICTED: uncharacterized protein LOC100633819 isoform X2 [Amphimedon queenslandica]|eukprot:XP_019855722.1 PREDICTED: uncharacterized protein LOC100633819 isoform X2 [Amphimedon queenslandica]
MAITEESLGRVLKVIKELLIHSESSGVDSEVLRPLESVVSTLSSPLFQHLVQLREKHHQISDVTEPDSLPNIDALQLESNPMGRVSNSDDIVGVSPDNTTCNGSSSPPLSPLDVPLPPPLSPLPDTPLLTHSEELQEVLVVKTQYQPRSVTLQRKGTELETSSLGIQVQGLSRTGLFISDLPIGGVAQRCGLLRVGDRLLSINGMSCGNTKSWGHSVNSAI